MNAKHLVTGLVLVLAVAGLVAVFLGGGAGGDSGGSGPADGAGEPQADRRPAAATASPDADAGADAGADGLPADGLVVYYFHGYKRCLTCNRIEALAEETIWDEFAAPMRAGTVVFRSVNIETDEHRHFVQDYELATKVVVISERRGGQEVGWRRLDEVWQKVGDEQEYRRYIASSVGACLRALGLEAG